ncbi:putative inorganic phosphate cotransporter [Folsomia candida]|uniref:putative inorganic phosphate cotransporter n=1 Tax=Folsomia candida TaxID=158441 RepID=UPI0016055E40|nr:putative inorganic phosphate cotransporter [Folsomia candida]
MSPTEHSFCDPISFDTRPKGIGRRHVLAILGFVAFALSYSMRFNLSIAIVAMVKSSNTIKPTQPVDDIMFEKDICTRNLVLHNHQIPQTNNLTKADDEMYLVIPISSDNDTGRNKYSFGDDAQKPQNFGPAGNNGNVTSVNEDDGEFDWSEAEQGFILGSFFWGYLITQIPGGWMGHKFGGKWPVGIGLFVTALLAIITPATARWGGFQAIVMVRILQGLAGGITVPCMHTLLARWIPPNERGQLTALVYAGMSFGTALSLISSGYIIHYLGWPFVFYITGGATILWFLLWSFLVYNSPSEHPHINSTELKFIQNAIQGYSDGEVSKPRRPPWGKIIRSSPFWAIVFGQLTETWGLYTIMSELPTYMKTVLHYDIKENSLLSALPHFLTWCVGLTVPRVGDFLIKRRYARVGTVRKLCNTIGMWGSAAALLGVAYAGCDRTITVTLLSVGIAATGGILGGVLVNLIDIAPNFAGILMGITNSAGTIPGFLAPWVAGIIIDNDPSLNHWRLVFMITAGISFTGNLLFLLLSSGEEQPWNNYDENEDDSITNQNDVINMTEIDLTKFYSLPVPDVAPSSPENISIHD